MIDTGLTESGQNYRSAEEKLAELERRSADRWTPAKTNCFSPWK